MKIRTFLNRKKFTISDFAEYCDIPKQRMSSYIAERATPSVAYARKIIEASKGAITIADLDFKPKGFKKKKRRKPEDVLGKRP